MIIKSKKTDKSYVTIALLEHFFISLTVFMGIPLAIFLLRGRGKNSAFDSILDFMLNESIYFSLLVLGVIIVVNLFYYVLKSNVNYIYGLEFDDASENISIFYKYKYQKKALIEVVSYNDLKFEISSKETWYTNGKKSKVIKLFNNHIYKGQIFQDDYFWVNNFISLNNIIKKLKTISIK